MIGSRGTRLLPALLLTAACAGHRPLPTLEPVPGSRTRDGGEIVPLDSAARRTATTTAAPVREIQPLGETAPTAERPTLPRLEPTPAEASTEREIRRLVGDANAPTTERMIQPLGRGTPSGLRDVAPAPGEFVVLDSTRWVGANTEGPITFEFLIGGILRYTTSNGVFTNGTWQQTGSTVTFELNSRYAEYSGQIRGTRMSGTWHNRAGVRANWEATRQ